MSAITKSLRSLKVPSLASFFKWRKAPKVQPRVAMGPPPPRSYPPPMVGKRRPLTKMVNAALNSRPPRPKLRDLGIRVHEVPPSPFPICKEPLKVLTETHIRHLDPSGTRTRLFAPTNPERVCPGDILLVRQRSGDPFAGVVISIKRAGTDTAVLLRGQLTRVGVEMWFKVYSPNVVGMEVVKRAEKRARRARLTYLRKPEHDKGSVENVVRHYLKQRAALGSASANATLKKTSKR